MKFNELNIKANRKRNRVGRGIAAGQGKTAGRGTKGQGARAGGGKGPGFEGGQTPLTQRLPKLRGFTSHRTPADTIYTSQLDQFASKTVDNFVLSEAGLVESPHTNVKLIVKGEVTKKVTVKLQGASASAIAAVQKAGGTFTIAPRVQRQAKKSE